MPPAWEKEEYKKSSGTSNNYKAKQLLDKIKVGEEITLSEYEDPSKGAKRRKRRVNRCEVTQKSKHCLFVRWNNRIKCITEPDIITGECQIWRDNDHETVNY